MTPLAADADADADADAALAPVREALLARARADADRLLADADADVARRLLAAQEEAARRIADARARGAAQAAREFAAERVQAKRQARALVLAARREAYDALVRDCRAGLARLREDAVYPQLLERLAGQVRDVLGGDAQVREAPAGGVVGQARGRRVDASLPTLADRGLARLGGEVEQLWAT